MKIDGNQITKLQNDKWNWDISPSCLRAPFLLTRVKNCCKISVFFGELLCCQWNIWSSVWKIFNAINSMFKHFLLFLDSNLLCFSLSSVSSLWVNPLISILIEAKRHQKINDEAWFHPSGKVNWYSPEEKYFAKSS